MLCLIRNRSRSTYVVACFLLLISVACESEDNDAGRLDGLEACSVGASDEERIRYATDAVPFGELCNGQTQMRTCENGLWTPWSGTFTEKFCYVRGSTNCDDTPHGGEQTRIRYPAPLCSVWRALQWANANK